jgi:hypothetical protein
LKEEKIPIVCYHVSFIEIGWVNDKLSMHGKIIYFMKLEKVPKMHKNDSFTWQMANCMQNMVLATTKHVVQKTNFFPLNYEEVTTINNYSWISIHAYVVEN